MKQSIYDNKSDDEIITIIRKGDRNAEEYLLEKYSNIVKKEIRMLYIVGAETEDLSQEGMIALFSAIGDYKIESKASFSTFATICVKNKLKTAVTASNRQKHMPLNNYISMYGNDYKENSEIMIADSKSEINNTNPEELILEKEEYREKYKEIDEKLSAFEKKVVNLYLQGLSYTKMSEILNKPKKSIDNALARVRKKLSKSD